MVRRAALLLALLALVWPASAAEEPVYRAGFFVGTSPNEFDGTDYGTDVADNGVVVPEWVNLVEPKMLPQVVPYIDFYLSLEEAPDRPSELNFTVGWQTNPVFSMSVQWATDHIVNGDKLTLRVGKDNQKRLHVMFDCLLGNSSGDASLDLGLEGGFEPVPIVFRFNCSGSKVYRRGLNVALSPLGPANVVNNGVATGRNISYDERFDLAVMTAYLSNLGPKNTSQSFGVVADTSPIFMTVDVDTPLVTLHEDKPEQLTFRFHCGVNNTERTSNLVTISIIFYNSPYTDISFNLIKDCPVGTGSLSGGGGGGGNGWSGFGIFCFVVLMVVLVGFIGGCLFNFFGQRKRGLDVIPGIGFCRRCFGIGAPVYTPQDDVTTSAEGGSGGSYGSYQSNL